ncbi:Uma2 family endonuclease [Longimicrobium sp.]|uniref:Uma2 family endonuclease n=1 Tax=Longimicrobium sp. TaxID=2029185 RepID=UPI002E355F70|nr:Uma2 family endonuclease [Longimicrobium sp.]HEX6042378.1 Uma2 family endonuclease [Longimicrobium sp.]
MSTQSAAVRDWTYDDFARLPDDGNRYEVIAGELFVTPPPDTPHQEASARFFMEMRDFATRKHGLGLVLYAPVAVVLGDGDYVEPDIVFLRREHEHYRTRRAIEGPPDLVVEILSPATARQDRGVKRQRYAQFGVAEYWIVDTDRRRVEVYRLREDPDHARLVADRLTWSPVPGGPVLELNVVELLADLDPARER